MVPAERMGRSAFPFAWGTADPHAAALGAGAAVRRAGRGICPARGDGASVPARVCRAAWHGHGLYGAGLRKARPAGVPRGAGGRDVLRGLLLTVACERASEMVLFPGGGADDPAAARAACPHGNGGSGSAPRSLPQRAHPFAARAAGQRQHLARPCHRAAGDRAVRTGGAASFPFPAGRGRPVRPA